MPASYAHLTFGRRVFDSLPECEAKKLIRNRTDLFEIGLLGPDILFFYHPLSHHPANRIGHDLHDQSGESFLNHEVCQNAENGQLAYLLGFICHYALDSECHTLVEYYIQKKHREHSSIEADLERALMARDGLDPFRFSAASCIRVTDENAVAIAPFFGVSPRVIKTALMSMKVIGRILTPSSKSKHYILTLAGKLMGEGCVVHQLIMDRIPDPVYSESNRSITQCIDESIPVAVALMNDFLAWQHGEHPLSQRFQPTFSFDKEKLARLKENDTCV